MGRLLITFLLCEQQVLLKPVLYLSHYFKRHRHQYYEQLQAVRDAGAVAASFIMLRLPREVSALFQDWLAQHYPDRAAKVMGRVRQLHGGRDYDPEFGKRMRGEGVWADLMAKRFAVAARRLGLDRRTVKAKVEMHLKQKSA